jgi:hypothetical protein
MSKLSGDLLLVITIMITARISWSNVDPLSNLSSLRCCIKVQGVGLSVQKSIFSSSLLSHIDASYEEYPEIEPVTMGVE